MQQPRPDHPQPPAYAAAVMLAIMPPTYFRREPPKSGIRLRITSTRDRVATTWDVDVDLANWLRGRIPSDLVVEAQEY